MTERDGRECVSRMCEYILSFCTFVHERDGGVRIYRRKREREGYRIEVRDIAFGCV